ncbi:hypothetical protein AX14_011269 [Amanita brunnescens Koide BX004]|nr:hypothetical protein AX14_011269 [Amanita brunnescens Koide BX004]
MVPTLLFPLFAALLTLSIAFPHDRSSLSSRHNRLAHRAELVEPRSVSKRCQNRNSVKNDTASHVISVASGAGLIKATSSACGPSGATKETTSASGPNGNIYWLNCGITDEDDTEDSKGWNPPNVTIGELVYLDLQDVITQPNNIYQLCASYVPLFEKYGKMYGIPPILMAAFAMQESSCNPDAVGEGGEQGLMQISKDKCGGAPDGNCRDPDFNIHTATKFFYDLLASNNGNALLSFGSYNGWFMGMTLADATAAATSSCCHCQNNLAYIHGIVNAGLLGIDSHSLTPPKVFDNLAVCGA